MGRVPWRQEGTWSRNFPKRLFHQISLLKESMPMCACIDEKKSIVCSVSYVRVRVPPPGGHCKVIIVLLNSRFRMLVYIYTHTHTHAHTHTHTHTHHYQFSSLYNRAHKLYNKFLVATPK